MTTTDFSPLGRPLPAFLLEGLCHKIEKKLIFSGISGKMKGFNKKTLNYMYRELLQNIQQISFAQPENFKIFRRTQNMKPSLLITTNLLYLVVLNGKFKEWILHSAKVRTFLRFLQTLQSSQPHHSSDF
jgi:hypothetical protein